MTVEVRIRCERCGTAQPKSAIVVERGYRHCRNLTACDLRKVRKIKEDEDERRREEVIRDACWSF